MAMSLFFLINMLMITTWTLMSLNNPMNMSLIIISMTIIMSLMMCISNSSWYALILFLIYVGGMMVMFSYFTSLCSNDSMTLKSKMHFVFLPVMLMKTMELKMILPPYSNMQLNKIYFINNNIILFMVMMVLLLMMIIVIKMIKILNTPLRSFNM